MIPKVILKEEEVALEIDLKKLFGKSISDPAIIESIADSFIKKIEERTADGKGVNADGKVVKFKSPYSEQYSKSIEFKAFDKNKAEVNLKQTGSMLASIDLIDQRGSKIRIGIDNEEAPKAHGHMTGANGRLPIRPFLGLTAKDLEEVKKEFASEVKNDEPITAADIFEDRNLSKILKSLRSRKNNFGFEE